MRTLNSTLFLSDKELVALHSELALVRKVRERDALLIEVALETGVRECELVAIEFSNLDPVNKSVYIDTRKGGTDRDIPFLNEDLFNRLYNFAKTITGPIFNINESRVRQIWYEVRPVTLKKSFHKLRHTFGRTRSLQCGRDIYLMRYLMGHKSIASTQIYTDLDFTPEMIRANLGKSQKVQISA